MTRSRAELHARGAEAYKAVAIASVQSNQPDVALRAFDSARRLDPADASNYLNVAVLQAQGGDFADARVNAQTALRLHPGYEQAEGLLRAIDGR